MGYLRSHLASWRDRKSLGASDRGEFDGNRGCAAVSIKRGQPIPSHQAEIPPLLG